MNGVNDWGGEAKELKGIDLRRQDYSNRQIKKFRSFLFGLSRESGVEPISSDHLQCVNFTQKLA